MSRSTAEDLCVLFVKLPEATDGRMSLRGVPLSRRQQAWSAGALPIHRQTLNLQFGCCEALQGKGGSHMQRTTSGAAH